MTKGREHHDQPIAVLPFVNVSGAPKIDALGECLAIKVARLLGSARDPTRTACALRTFWHGADVQIQDVGWHLHAELLLMGSVRVRPETVVTAAQLVDTRTGRWRWHGAFESPGVTQMSETLAEEFAAAVCDAVRVVLRRSGAEPRPHPGASSVAVEGWGESRLHWESA